MRPLARAPATPAGPAGSGPTSMLSPATSATAARTRSSVTAKGTKAAPKSAYVNVSVTESIRRQGPSVGRDPRDGDLLRRVPGEHVEDAASHRRGGVGAEAGLFHHHRH